MFKVYRVYNCLEIEPKCKVFIELRVKVNSKYDFELYEHCLGGITYLHVFSKKT